jgi:hypothetical protein
VHIVCDAGNECPRVLAYLHPEIQYAGPTEQDVRRQLRDDGWLLKRDGRTFCRRCRIEHRN